MKNNNTLVFGIVGVVVLMIVALFVKSRPAQLPGAEFVQNYTTTPDAVLLDVRTPREFSSGHIDTAVNIDIEDPSFATEIKKLDTSKTYFVYCRSGNRSAQAVSLMKSLGITHMYELRGGLMSNVDQVQLVTTDTPQ